MFSQYWIESGSPPCSPQMPTFSVGCVRRPRSIPIWIGGTADAVLERVGKMGDGWYPQIRQPSELPANIEKINAAGSVVPGLLYFAGVFQVGTCFNILFSAWTARLVIQGVTSGTFKRMVQK